MSTEVAKKWSFTSRAQSILCCTCARRLYKFSRDRTQIRDELCHVAASAMRHGTYSSHQRLPAHLLFPAVAGCYLLIQLHLRRRRIKCATCTEKVDRASQTELACLLDAALTPRTPCVMPAVETGNAGENESMTIVSSKPPVKVEIEEEAGFAEAKEKTAKEEEAKEEEAKEEEAKEEEAKEKEAKEEEAKEEAAVVAAKELATKLIDAAVEDAEAAAWVAKAEAAAKKAAEAEAAAKKAARTQAKKEAKASSPTHTKAQPSMGLGQQINLLDRLTPPKLAKSAMSSASSLATSPIEAGKFVGSGISQTFARFGAVSGFQTAIASLRGGSVDLSDAELDKLFTQIDADRSGRISYNEMYMALSKKYGKELEPSVIKQMMAAADTDDDGEISLDEFKTIMRVKPPKKALLMPSLGKQLSFGMLG